MSNGKPEQIIPRQVDPRKFALHGVAVKGSVPVEELKRLAEATVGVNSLEAELQFGFVDRKPVVTGSLKGSVVQQCQRCLEPVEVALACAVRLSIVMNEQQAKDLAKEQDFWLVPEESADLHAMLEEEALLALPFVAFHDYDCVDASLFRRGPVDEPAPTKAAGPFGVLEQLKKSGDK